jgi:hypothetical protein
MQKGLNLGGQNCTIKIWGAKIAQLWKLGRLKSHNWNLGGQNRTIVKLGEPKLHLSLYANFKIVVIYQLLPMWEF